MALTRDFKETIVARAQRDPIFRSGLLKEGVDLLLDGEVEAGKSLLRTYVNATVGFETLSAEVGVPAKSLMRMLSSKGNPRADNLFAIIKVLQERTGVHLTSAA